MYRKNPVKLLIAAICLMFAAGCSAQHSAGLPSQQQMQPPNAQFLEAQTKRIQSHIAPGSKTYSVDTYVIRVGNDIHSIPAIAPMQRTAAGYAFTLPNGDVVRFPGDAIVETQKGTSHFVVSPGSKAPQFLKSRQPDGVQTGASAP